MVRLTDRLDMTVVVDWDVKPQNKHTISLCYESIEQCIVSSRSTHVNLGTPGNVVRGNQKLCKRNPYGSSRS